MLAGLRSTLACLLGSWLDFRRVDLLLVLLACDDSSMENRGNVNVDRGTVDVVHILAITLFDDMPVENEIVPPIKE